MEKVGAVEEFSYSDDFGTLPHQLLERMYSYWKKSVINYSGKEYYTNYGLPSGFDKVVQTGVLVLSPRHHRPLLEKAYNDHEEKGGPEWNYEMRPLSYELLKADAVHWMDPCFNLMWVYSLFLYYPFLVENKTDSSLGGRFKRKLATAVDAPSFNTVQEACLTAAFLNSFFFHVGGVGMEKLKFVDQTAVSFNDCIL